MSRKIKFGLKTLQERKAELNFLKKDRINQSKISLSKRKDFDSICWRVNICLLTAISALNHDEGRN